MADGNGPGRITIAGLAFAFMMLILIVVSLWLFIARPWWFPELASVRGADIDGVFTAVLIVTGIAFIGVQAVLGYFVARYGTRGTERAGYWHDNPKAEAGLLIGTAVILTVLVFMGQKRLGNIYFTDAPPGSLEVQVTGGTVRVEFSLCRARRGIRPHRCEADHEDGPIRWGWITRIPQPRTTSSRSIEMHAVVGKAV